MMRDRFRERWIVMTIAVTALLTGHIVLAEDSQPDQATVRRHAEESIQRLERQAKQAGRLRCRLLRISPVRRRQAMEPIQARTPFR